MGANQNDGSMGELQEGNSIVGDSGRYEIEHSGQQVRGGDERRTCVLTGQLVSEARSLLSSLALLRGPQRSRREVVPTRESWWCQLHGRIDRFPRAREVFRQHFSVSGAVSFRETNSLEATG